MLKRIPTDEARQGRRGVQVLIVLVVGLFLAMAAWAVAELYGYTITPADEQQVGDPQTPSVEPPRDGTPAGSQ